MKEPPTKYLESAIQFFQSKFGIDKVDCKFEYTTFKEHYHNIPKKYRLILPVTLGYYDPFTNTIGINGVDRRQRNELVGTMFHELVHWWQHRVIKTLNYLTAPPLKCGCFDIDDVIDDKPVLNDCYHQYTRPASPYGRKKLFYNSTDTTDIRYWEKPHEVEARKMAKELFAEWNDPKYKGKCNQTR